ncbi:Putative ribonuclease H protein At1g65750 [Linum perenne]
MQTAFLPAHICDSIDRKIRNFIWGSVEGARKIHNINWETVCKPKRLGGLGLRTARDLNKAFLMKIVWGLLRHPSDLWVKVLTGKYLKKTSEGFVLARNSGFSAFWRGVMKVWPNLVNGLQWSIGEGRSTRFWIDRWLDSGVILIDHALNLQGVNASLTVSAACSDNDGWNSEFIFSSLPRDIALQVLGMSSPRSDLGPDSLVWGLEPNGRFSIRSAYQLLNDFSDDVSGPNWDHIWSWTGPNKIRHFLCLATHNRLPLIRNVTDDILQTRLSAQDALLRLKLFHTFYLIVSLPRRFGVNPFPRCLLPDKHFQTSKTGGFPV